MTARRFDDALETIRTDAGASRRYVLCSRLGAIESVGAESMTEREADERVAELMAAHAGRIVFWKIPRGAA